MERKLHVDSDGATLTVNLDRQELERMILGEVGRQSKREEMEQRRSSPSPFDDGSESLRRRQARRTTSL